METFSALLALCEGNPPVTDGFPAQRTHHRAHYDVSVMSYFLRLSIVGWTLHSTAAGPNVRDEIPPMHVG